MYSEKAGPILGMKVMNPGVNSMKNFHVAGKAM
jgi:hypothetical protein